MASSQIINQINLKEQYPKELNNNINKDEINKLNILFDETIDLNKFISEKIEGLEGLEYNSRIELVCKNEEEKITEKIDKKDKRRKKAIYELLNFYKKANCDKSLKFKLSPFKPLIKPKIIEMDKRILLNTKEINL